MTEWERLSVAVTPEQKTFLDHQDESTSEMFRRFVEGWRQEGDPPDGREMRREQLEKEIDELDDREQEIRRQKEERKELLEKIDQRGVHPSDEEAVTEYVEKINTWEGSLAQLNPDNIIVQDRTSQTLSARDLVLQAVKRADKTPLDTIVADYRVGEIKELAPENVPVRSFNRTSGVGRMDDIDPAFAVELVRTRHEALPDDWGGPVIESKYRSRGDRTWDLPQNAVRPKS
jgi:hypothetical protein